MLAREGRGVLRVRNAVAEVEAGSSARLYGECAHQHERPLTRLSIRSSGMVAVAERKQALNDGQTVQHRSLRIGYGQVEERSALVKPAKRRRDDHTRRSGQRHSHHGVSGSLQTAQWDTSRSCATPRSRRANVTVNDQLHLAPSAVAALSHTFAGPPTRLRGTADGAARLPHRVGVVIATNPPSPSARRSASCCVSLVPTRYRPNSGSAQG